MYTVGGTGAPQFTFSWPSGAISASTNGLSAYGANFVSLLDLTVTPAKTDVPVPITGNTTIALDSTTRWLVGNQDGVILDGGNLPARSRYLDYGRVWSVAGSNTNLALATASGRILLFDTTGFSTLTKVTGIDPASPVIGSDNSIPSSPSPAWPSPDGTLLAAAGLPGQKDSKTSIISNGVLSATIPGAAELQVVTSDSIYSNNAIVSVTSGETIWSSGDLSTGDGSVAGGYVVFPVGTRVVALMH